MTQPALTRMSPSRMSPAIGRIYRPLELPCGQRIEIKIEGYRADASIKEKPATEMLAAGLAQGLIDPAIGIIETSSGNTARALAAAGGRLGIPVTLVVDPNVTETNVAVMDAFGARVLRVETADPGGGYQRARIHRVRSECAAMPSLHWTNQYDNPTNALAHMKTTGPEILTVRPDVARVYCAVGTGGTATGLGRFFRQSGSAAAVIGCDVVGSVTFGGPPGPRHISGPGNSFVPGNWDALVVARKISVPEPEAVAVCRWLADCHGLLLGGSTGLVLAGAIRDVRASPLGPCDGPVIAISADTGEKYLSQFWNDRWVEERYGLAALEAARRSLGLTA